MYLPRSAAKPAVNAICYESETDRESEDEEEAGVLALQPKSFRKGGPSGSTSKSKPAKESSQLLCWNCRKTGHMWRDCDRKKGIFRHICGTQDTTAYRCPENHNLRPQDSSPEVAKSE